MIKNWMEDLVRPELKTDYLLKIKEYIQAERKSGVAIAPEPEYMFRAYQLTPFESVKVVILGQDPYPGAGIADGLAFSTKTKITPSSLKIILSEINHDLYNNEAINAFRSNDLSQWAIQGVFLLNTALSVKVGVPNSHKDLGWITLIEKTIRALNYHPLPIVFMLWGAHAKKLKTCISNPQHLILEAAHPNSETYNTDGKKQLFFGCKHFSQANKFLEDNGRTSINWTLI